MRNTLTNHSDYRPNRHTRRNCDTFSEVEGSFLCQPPHVRSDKYNVSQSCSLSHVVGLAEITQSELLQSMSLLEDTEAKADAEGRRHQSLALRARWPSFPRLLLLRIPLARSVFDAFALYWLRCLCLLQEGAGRWCSCVDSLECFASYIAPPPPLVQKSCVARSAVFHAYGWPLYNNEAPEEITVWRECSNTMAYILYERRLS